MPIYAPIEEVDQSKSLDMRKVTYGFGAEVSAAYENIASNFRTGRMVELAGQPPDPRYPGTMPASEAEIAEIKKIRPDFNPPKGISKAVVQALADNYDNNKYYQKVSSRPSGLLAKAGVYVGGFFGQFYDPKNVIYGFSGVGAAEVAVTPIAESWLAKAASSKLVGNQVSKIGSLISENIGPPVLRGTIGGAGYGFTAGLEEETAAMTGEDTLGEQHDYVQNLINLGRQTIDGAITGGIFGAGHYALFGRKVSIAPAAEINIPPEEYGKTLSSHETFAEAEAATNAHAKEAPTPHEYNIYEKPEGGYKAFARNLGGKVYVPEKFERRGGLLSRTPMRNLPDNVKDFVGQYFNSWTPESDKVMRTESMGQMANGQFVDISPIEKQGKYEQGVKFREEMVKQDIDPDALDGALQESQEHIISTMFAEHFAKEGTQKDKDLIKVGDEQLLKDLYQEYVTAQDMRDQVNGDIKPVSPDEMKAYADHLEKGLLPEQEFSIEPDERYKVDEQLATYSDQDIETLAASSESSGKEIRETMEQLAKQGQFEEMAQNMTDCFLRNV